MCELKLFRQLSPTPLLLIMNPSIKKTSSSHTRAIRVFRKWMLHNGFEFSDALEFGMADGIVAETGVIALCDLKEGDLIATIPKKACLTVKTTMAVALLEEAGLAGGLMGLTLALMYERSKAEASTWYGYLQLLPHQQLLPFLWTKEEVDTLLVGTELHEVVKEDKRLMKEDWQECICPLIEQDPHEFPKKWFSFHEYLAAKSLVSSRSFEVDEYHGFGMVPLVDLFNHKTAAEDVHFTSSEAFYTDTEELFPKEPQDDIACPFNIQGKSCGKDASNEANIEESSCELFEILLVKDVVKSTEIFNTYGALSNAALLHRYGFTEINNPFDIVNVDLTLITEVCEAHFSQRHSRRCVRLWRKAGFTACKSEGTEYFEICNDGKPQVELLLLLYLHATNHIFEVLENRIDEIRGQVEKVAQLFDWKNCDKLVEDIQLQGFPKLSNATKRMRLNVCGSISAEAHSLEESDISSVSLDSIEMQLLTPNVCHIMLLLLEKRDSMYPTPSLIHDKLILQSTSSKEHPKMFHAVQLRASEREVLRRCRNLIEHVHPNSSSFNIL